MNAGTFNQAVTPILAIVATPDFKRQRGNQTKKKNQKKRMSFPSFNQAADVNCEVIIYETTNCYGSNGKQIVKYASCFNETL